MTYDPNAPRRETDDGVGEVCWSCGCGAVNDTTHDYCPECGGPAPWDGATDFYDWDEGEKDEDEDFWDDWYDLDGEQAEPL